MTSTPPTTPPGTLSPTGSHRWGGAAWQPVQAPPSPPSAQQPQGPSTLRDARPSDWIIAGLFFTFGAVGAGLLLAIVVGLLVALGLGAVLHR